MAPTKVSSTATPANVVKKTRKTKEHAAVANLAAAVAAGAKNTAPNFDGGTVTTFRKTLLEGLVHEGYVGVAPQVTPSPVVVHNIVSYPTDNAVGSNTIVFKLTTAFNQLVR